MDGSKVEEVSLVKLPPELIQRVGILCDVKSLGRLSITCKVLHFILSDDVVWRQQWQYICRRYNLVTSTLDPAKTTYRDACIRSTICLFDGIFQNDVEAMTEGPGLGWSHVRNAMAFDCGSKTASIAWLFDYYRSSCPAITAHLKVKCRCESERLPHPFVMQPCACKTLSLAELNQELKSQGHPALFRPVVVGQKAKHLLGQYPHLYEREEYPIYFSQPFCNQAQGQRSGKSCNRESWHSKCGQGGSDQESLTRSAPESGQIQGCLPSGDQEPRCSASTSSLSTSMNSSSGLTSSVPKMATDALLNFEQSQFCAGNFRNRPSCSTHLGHSTEQPQLCASNFGDQPSCSTPSGHSGEQPQFCASHFRNQPSRSTDLRHSSEQTQFCASKFRNRPSCSTHPGCSSHIDSEPKELSCKPQVYFQVCNPVKDGDIVSLKDYELLLRHLHGSVTGGSQQLAHMRDICRTAFLLCEPARCSHETRVGLLKLMFEKLKVSRICLQNKAGLLPMDSSFNTCLMIESGATSTVVTPIINSRIQQDAVQFKPVGGLHVSLALAETITSKGVVNEVCVDSLDDRGVKEECWLAYQPLFETRKKFATKNILVSKPRGKTSYSSIPFGSERYLACEDMYCSLDLPNMVGDALHRCPPSSHRALLTRIILTGGNGALKGFPQRLTRDLKERLPRYAEVIMVSRFDDVFTLLTLLGPGLDQKRWITRAEYVFEGEQVLDRYCWPEAYA